LTAGDLKTEVAVEILKVKGVNQWAGIYIGEYRKSRDEAFSTAARWNCGYTSESFVQSAQSMSSSERLTISISVRAAIPARC